MYDDDPKSRGMDLPVYPEESIHLRPGQDAIVRIRYGQSKPQHELVWAGKRQKPGDQGPVFCQIMGDCRQDQNVRIDTRTAVARIVGYGQFPGQPGFVRPGKARYEEWQQLIHECTVSRQARMRAERLEQILREREPPCTQTQRYQWPTKLLMCPQSQAAEVKMVKLQVKPKPLDMTLKIIVNSAVVMNTVARDPKEPETRPEPVQQIHPDLSPEVKTLDPESMANVENDAQVPKPSVDVQSQMSCSTPVQRLEAEYARVMRVSAEELDLDYEIIMLPEIEELTPECSIDEANVGVPGVTTPEMEAKMRGILKRHRSIFLGDGNAAPSPATGVVCTSTSVKQNQCLYVRDRLPHLSW
ncbi:Aspartic protease [Phytophthora megakarya]|uniref:Aspartic protease n=1 Tax=Phytophthora megakarya TaxID=4795 RepID=A0A225UDF8_9STRA|nr:Aspartic protease [Phytophthora megakarya]